MKRRPSSIIVDWLPDGNATQPSLTFVNDPDTGLYRAGTNDLALATGGVDRLRVDASGTSLTGGLDVSGNTTVYGTTPTFTIAPSSTLQYEGSSLRLLNNAHESTRRGVSLGTLVRDSDSNNSIFSIDILDSSNVITQTAMQYDLSDEKLFVIGDTRITGDVVEVHGSSPSVTVQAFSSAQYDGGKLALYNAANLVTRRGATVGTYVRDSDGTDSYFAIDATSNTGAYLATLGRYDLSDHRWSFHTQNAERLAIEPAGNVSVTGNLNTSQTVTATLLSGNLKASTITSGTGNVSVTGNLNVSGLITGQGLAADLSISNVQITDSSWNLVDDTHVGLTEGYILVNGAGFAPGSMVQVGGTNAVSVGYVSSTQLRVQTPAKSTGTYNVTVIRGDTKTATLPSSVSYSMDVLWLTSSDLSIVRQYLPFIYDLSAVSDSAVTYANLTTLPTGMALNPTTGQLTGNLTTSNVDTLYSLDINAEDQQLQDSTKTFLMQYKGFSAGRLAGGELQMNVNLGWSCSMNSTGTRIVVGAYLGDYNGTDTGFAFTYRSENGVWVKEQRLYASNAATNDQFGYSCCMSGDGTRICIGAPKRDISGVADIGSVYVYKRTDNEWVEEAYIPPPERPGTLEFGSSCAINHDGSVMIIGGPTDNTTTTRAGSAYIYVRVDTVWVFKQKLISPNIATDERFGESCAIDATGDRIMVTEVYHNNYNTGTAYIYTRAGSSWQYEAQLVIPGEGLGGYFGKRCALSADGTRATFTTQDIKMFVFVFVRSGTTWSVEQKLLPSTITSAQKMSCAINQDGSIIVIGAGTDQKLYVFTRSGSTWTEQQILTTTVSGSATYLGVSCATNYDGSIICAGANGNYVTSNDGTAIVFQRTYNGWKDQWT